MMMNDDDDMIWYIWYMIWCIIRCDMIYMVWYDIWYTWYDVWYDAAWYMIWYICHLQLGWHPVAVHIYTHTVHRTTQLTTEHHK